MYTYIAKKISNSNLRFWQRFWSILWLLLGIWIIGVVCSEFFPKEREKISPILEAYRYFFAFGVVWAMIGLGKKNR